jgi:DNA-directed RNA polymerase omega subunit
MTNQDSKNAFHSVFQKFPNRFLLAVATGKRAKQLKDSARPLVEVQEADQTKYVETALRELMEDQVKILIKEPNMEESEMLQEFDELLNSELEVVDEEKEEKKVKDKTRSKKSLAA